MLSNSSPESAISSSVESVDSPNKLVGVSKLKSSSDSGKLKLSSGRTESSTLSIESNSKSSSAVISH